MDAKLETLAAVSMTLLLVTLPLLLTCPNGRSFCQCEQDGRTETQQEQLQEETAGMASGVEGLQLCSGDCSYSIMLNPY